MPLILLCDHASNAVPAEYGDLGIAPAQFARHIAYDIGARDLTLGLAARLNAPAVLSRFSRLLIDPNRGLDDPTLIMRISDGAVVPGNRHVDEVERLIRTLSERYAADAFCIEAQRRGIPATPVNGLDDLLQDHHLREVGYWQVRPDTGLGDITWPGPPYRLSRTPARMGF